MYCNGIELVSRLNEILSKHLKSTRLGGSRLRLITGVFFYSIN